MLVISDIKNGYHFHVSGLTDEVDLEFDGAGALVSALLAEAGAESLAGALDYPGRREAFAEEFIGLAAGLGGAVDVAAKKVETPDMPAAGYLVPGSRIHIRLKSASWQTAVALVPVIAGIVATGGILLPILGAAPLLVALQQAITPLTEHDKVLVLAVTALGKSLGRPVSADEVRERLRARDQESSSHVKEALERLAAAGVLKWDQDGFSARF